MSAYVLSLRALLPVREGRQGIHWGPVRSCNHRLLLLLQPPQHLQSRRPEVSSILSASKNGQVVMHACQCHFFTFFATSIDFTIV